MKESNVVSFREHRETKIPEKLKNNEHEKSSRRLLFERLFCCKINYTERHALYDKQLEDETFQVDLPPCTKTVVTCSCPPRSTIARYHVLPLVSYVKIVLARGLAKDCKRRRTRFLSKGCPTNKSSYSMLIEDTILTFYSILTTRYPGGWFVFVAAAGRSAGYRSRGLEQTERAPQLSPANSMTRRTETLSLIRPVIVGSTLDAILRRLYVSSILS